MTAKLDDVGVPEQHTARLVGHKVHTVTYGLYSGGLNFPKLREVVAAIKYNGLFQAQQNFQKDISG